MIGALLLAGGNRVQALTPLTPEEVAAKAHLVRLLDREYRAMWTLRRPALEALFLPGSSSAREALKVAWARAQYWHAWGASRHLDWGLTIRVRTPGIRFQGAHRIAFFAIVQEQYRYHYQGTSGPFVTFGIGSRHYDLVIQKEQGHWYIADDDFTNRVTRSTMARVAEGFLNGPPPAVAPVAPGAQRAVQYADRYCGSAPGCGGGWDGRYNPRYRNYNGDGGDCTSFISQILRAGGFPETAGWHYDRNLAEGDRPWSNADGLASFLEASGRAVLYARGTYRAVTQSEPGRPRGAIGQLQVGDLIGYQEHGTLVHTALVVGFDAHGEPLTDTHTNDRFHTPWEFGWDRATVYWLWHVRYPKPTRSSHR